MSKHSSRSAALLTSQNGWMDGWMDIMRPNRLDEWINVMRRNEGMNVMRPKMYPAMVPPPPSPKQTSVVPSQAEWEWDIAPQRDIMGNSKVNILQTTSKHAKSFHDFSLKQNWRLVKLLPRKRTTSLLISKHANFHWIALSPPYHH